MPRLLFSLAIAASLAACSSSKPATLASAPASVDLSVDGQSADWSGVLRPVDKQPGLSLGVRNDGESLSLALVANTPEQALRLSRGVTFWFDSEGGSQKGFGVGFPLRPERGARGRGEGTGPGAEAGDPNARMDRVRERFNEGTRRMAVYRGGGGELQLAVGDVEVIEADAEWTEAGLVIELRVPLAASDGYAVGAAPGETVGLGIETVDLPEGAGQGRGPGPGGMRPDGGIRPGGGQGGGMRPGGRGGMRGGDGAPRQLPTETTWMRVALAR